MQVSKVRQFNTDNNITILCIRFVLELKYPAVYRNDKLLGSHDLLFFFWGVKVKVFVILPCTDSQEGVREHVHAFYERPVDLVTGVSVFVCLQGR